MGKREKEKERPSAGTALKRRSLLSFLFSLTWPYGLRMGGAPDLLSTGAIAHLVPPSHAWGGN